MQNNEQDTVPAKPHAPLPETAELLNNLKKLHDYVGEGELYRAPKEALQSLPQAIEYIRNGEPFHPDPKPESGQGKWRETVAMCARNEEFYRGLIQQIGEILGPQAYTSDDGSVQDGVLALKVPELVRELKEYRDKKEKAEQEQRGDDPRLA